jgi:hypothetical protein
VKKQTDGTGALIDDDKLYFIQDARSCVGNCGSWWAPNSDGYVCSIDEAGRYRGTFLRDLRETDVPWPVDYVLARSVTHCRIDNADFDGRDDHRAARDRMQGRRNTEQPQLPVTGFHMRNGVDGKIEVLARVHGKWLVIFGDNGPGPVAVDKDQLIDHMIHAGGIQNLIDHGKLHVAPEERRICASCGNPEKPHNYRHPFRAWEPGMPAPRKRGFV